MESNNKVEMHFHDQSSNNPNATSVNYNYTINSDKAADHVLGSQEMMDTKPLMKYIFDDTTRNKFAVGLGTCSSAPEVASLLRQMVESRMLNDRDVRSKAFRLAVVPYLGYETNENALKTGLSISL